MAYFLQNYGQGYISRDGDTYQYVVNDKAVGTYDSMDELVAANSSDGKQTNTAKSTTKAATTADTTAPATTPVAKASAKQAPAADSTPQPAAK